MESNPENGDVAPIPAISTDQIFRMLKNLDYGRQVDLPSWDLPKLDGLPADKIDRELAIRLTNAFYRGIDSGGQFAGEGLWKSVSKLFHGPFIQALEVRDYDQIAHALAGMFYSPIATGLCCRPKDIDLLRIDPMARLQTADVVASLGMALGLIQVPNPAVAFPPNPLELNSDEILMNIADTLGWDIAPPQVGGIFGINFRGSLIPFKHLYQVYMAHRIQSVFGGPLESCLEIGGGVGFLSYISVTNGLVRDYCIIDLPLVNMMQGYLLLKSDLADHVVLYGEEPKANLSSGVRIRIYPDIAISDLRDQSFDFSVNQDSFPEMKTETMCRYFDELSRLTRSYFLSINHESAHPVGSNWQHGLVNIAIRDNSKLEPVYRMPYWLRPGYVEELYKVSNI